MLLSILVWLGLHCYGLAQKGSSNDPIIISQGYWHIDDIMYINLNTIPPYTNKASNCKYVADTTTGEEGKKSIEFTHGGPKKSKILDIAPDANCTDATFGSGTTKLLCGDTFYFMDSSSNGRSFSLKLSGSAAGNKFKRFAPSGYSMLLTSTNATGGNLEVTYVNTFDSVSHTYNATASGLNVTSQVDGSPIIKYLLYNDKVTGNNVKMMLLFDGILGPQIQFNRTKGCSTFYIRPTEAVGGISGGTTLNFSIFHPIKEKAAHEATIIHDIFLNDTMLIFIYRFYDPQNKTGFSNRTVNAIHMCYKSISYSKEDNNPKINFTEECTEMYISPDIEDTPPFVSHTSSADTYMVRNVVDEYIGFFHRNTSDSYFSICKLMGPVEDIMPYMHVAGCSNGILLKLFHKDLTIPRFPPIEYKKETNSLKLHLEIKSTNNSLTYSSVYLELNTITGRLTLLNQWNIPNTIHLTVAKENTEERLHVIKQRYLEFYDTRYNYAKINFREYFSGRFCI